MSYAAFHAIFLVPPLLALGWLVGRRRHPAHRRAGRFVLLTAAIALLYTTPWDNYLVWRGVWSYGADRVLGTIGYVPVEEYLFFLLQPLLTGLWLLYLMPPHIPSAAPCSHRVGTLGYTALALLGVALLRWEAGTYLGLILAWAAPVLALQWGYAGRSIWGLRRVWVLGAAVPTLYLWAADAVALRLGIWRISEIHTLGPALGPLPLEEAVFFALTNLLVVQGLLLFLAPRLLPAPPAPASADLRARPATLPDG